MALVHRTTLNPKVSENKEGFYSRLFLVPKKDGQMQPVINLQPLNQFLVHNHFKNQRFLQFKWQKRAFQFTCLPFGLASALRVFTKILRPVVGFLWSKGIRCVIYLDDIYSPSRSGQDQAFRVNSNDVVVTRSLGFPGELPQVSGTNPEADLSWLHNRFNNEGAESSTGKDGCNFQGGQRYSGASEGFSSISCPTNRENVGSLIGHSACPSSLPKLKHTALRKKGYDCQICLSSAARKDLEWWIHNLSEWNGRAIQAPDPTLVVETDVSKIGWGAFCRGIITGGCWNAQKAQLHMNSLKTMASFLAIKAFTKECQQVSILLFTDNISVVAHNYQQNGWYKVSTTNFPGEGPVGMVSSKTNYGHSSASARSGQRDGRLSLQTLNRTDRLDAGSQYLPMSGQDLEPNVGRSFCNMFYQTTSSLLQLEAGP